MKKNLEKSKEDFAKDINQMFYKKKEEQAKKLNQLAQPILEKSGTELIYLFKKNLRIDEFHAEEVAIFYYCLNDTERNKFLYHFTQEEKEVIQFQYENLKNYNENALIKTL